MFDSALAGIPQILRVLIPRDRLVPDEHDRIAHTRYAHCEGFQRVGIGVISPL